MYEITILKWFGFIRASMVVEEKYFDRTRALLVGKYHCNIRWRKLGADHE